MDEVNRTLIQEHGLQTPGISPDLQGYKYGSGYGPQAVTTGPEGRYIINDSLLTKVHWYLFADFLIKEDVYDKLSPGLHFLGQPIRNLELGADAAYRHRVSILDVVVNSIDGFIKSLPPDYKSKYPIISKQHLHVITIYTALRPIYEKYSVKQHADYIPHNQPVTIYEVGVDGKPVMPTTVSVAELALGFYLGSLYAKFRAEQTATFTIRDREQEDQLRAMFAQIAALEQDARVARGASGGMRRRKSKRSKKTKKVRRKRHFTRKPL